VPGFESLSFGAPWILTALAALPIIYWLLRVTPPPPRRITFPPLRFLLGLKSPEETPARTPLWLLLLRLVAAAIIIAALAEPVLNAAPATTSSGPLVLFVDNGWTSAAQWSARQAAMTQALNTASRDGRAVVIVTTADKPKATPALLDAGKALKSADELAPRTWLPDRSAALARLASVKFPARPQIFWLSDGLDHGDAKATADGLARIGALFVFADADLKTPLALRPPESIAGGFKVTVMRGDAGPARDGRVIALDGHGTPLGDAAFRFAKGTQTATAQLTLPLELRNEAVRLAIAAQDSAGAVQLLDARFRRRPVGIVSGGSADVEQPLLSDIFYIERALTPFAEVRKGTIEQMLDTGIAMLVLADVGKLTPAEHDRVARFVEQGGVLLRFAGPRLATHADDLVPVKLRTGERLMGSALSWPEPQHLAAFSEDSPFRGLAIPSDVTVSRQVLAEPSIELSERSWARLADGTPLVTGEARGKGWSVLFHIAASPGWSSLPMSGLYVEMLRRTLALAEGVKPSGQNTRQAGTYPPLQVLDGFGRLQKPSAEALPINGADIDSTEPGPTHPPGLYGNETGFFAFNAVKANTMLKPLSDVGQTVAPYTERTTQELKWPLLVLALLLLLADALISLWLRGHLDPDRKLFRGLAHTAPLALLVLLAPHARADEAKNMTAALDTRLAYVITGVPDVDAMSRAGLYGLGLALKARTSYEPNDPVGVDLETDDLSFYPLLYWPMDAGEHELSPTAAAKIDTFMRNGGTILFDTRDATVPGMPTNNSPGTQTLRRLLAKLDIPPLERVPEDHVLTKTFYLLHEFPGRFDGGDIWVEALPPADPNTAPAPAPARGGDGVSPVIIGGNDWAAAWARDAMGQPIASVVGGERQRELATRFGINVVMYAMTGNYKADQVHVPALLERLGK